MKMTAPILVLRMASVVIIGSAPSRSFSSPRTTTTALPSSMPRPSMLQLQHSPSSQDQDEVSAQPRLSDANHRDHSGVEPLAGRSRRSALSTLVSSVSLISTASPATAADNFVPMNGLTRQIRRSVVKGAQLIDNFDGKWERFSDDLGLGAERNKPKRNVIDAGGNTQSKKVVRSNAVVDAKDRLLDEKTAYGFLQECDEVFMSCLHSYQPQTSTTRRELDRQIDKTKQLVRKSFFPSSASSKPTSAEEFNFECYTHFKVFNEILIEQKIPFPSFYREFESLIETRLQLTPSRTLSPSSNLTANLQNALYTTDDIANLLQKRGLIASWERSIPSEDDIEDFTTEKFDVSYSLALNGDITLSSQLLLQELGYRMYPSFGRWLLQKGTSQCFGSGPGEGAGRVIDDNDNQIAVQIDDYYMDPSYNSNPDLFEAKQVLFNVVIQRY